VRLLFDEHLSPRLVSRLADLFPDSTHVQLVGLRGASDRTLWQYARDHGLTLVSRDADFQGLSGVLGAPPKLVVLRIPDGPAAVAEAVLRRHAEAIQALAVSEDDALLLLAP